MKLMQRIPLLLACGLSFAASAQSPTPAQPLQLRSIMADMGRAAEQTTAAISKEEWSLVEQLAQKLANHPEPPGEEKLRIVTFLGKEAINFRGFDQQTHNAALELAAAAAQRDGRAVISNFAKVQESCLGCHQAYRQGLKQHFYGVKP